MSVEQEAPDADAVMAAEAHAVLYDGGCRAIRIAGSGDNWHVWGGYHAGQFFVTAFSEKNPDTPNDPVYLAHQVLATLLRNEGRSPYLEPEAKAAADVEALFDEPAAVDETPRTYDEATAEDFAEHPEDTPQIVADDPQPSKDDDPLSGAVVPLELGGDLGAEILDADYINEVNAPLLGFEAGADAEPVGLLDADISDFVPDEVRADAPGAFIFGDNLEQMRTAAIGIVVRISLERQPQGIDSSRLSELRNFAMGVTEGRWPDSVTMRDELDVLEAVERLRRMVSAVRDEKIAFLVGATREEIKAFDPSEGWP